MARFGEKQRQKVDPDCDMGSFEALPVAAKQQCRNGGFPPCAPARTRGLAALGTPRRFSWQQCRPADNGTHRRRRSGLVSGAAHSFTSTNLGEIPVTYRFLSIAAMTVAASAPALAVAQTAPAAQQTPNRPTLLRNLDSNFKLIDTNGDGTLVAAELAAAELKSQQQRMNAMRTQVEQRFTQLDTNKDGQLSKAEFMAVAPARPAAAGNGQNLLTPLDKNKDAKVTLDEYRAPILVRFDQMDTNKDGQISPAERQAATQTASRR